MHVSNFPQVKIASENFIYEMGKSLFKYTFYKVRKSLSRTLRMKLILFSNACLTQSIEEPAVFQTKSHKIILTFNALNPVINFYSAVLCLLLHRLFVSGLDSGGMTV